MRIKNKLHYILKYLVLAFPIIICLGAMFAHSDQYYALLELFMQSYLEDLLQVFPFYIQIFLALDIDITGLSVYSNYFLMYPLWVFAVYFFDLIVDVLIFIPKFFHDLLHKDYIK